MATIISQNAEQTTAAGAEFARTLRGGEVISLDGDLGAGKTHFVKGLVAALGSLSEVTSPTFTLVHEYRGGRLACFHFDFYRLQSAAELLGIGFDDYLDDHSGVCVIEWGGRFPSELSEALVVKIEVIDAEHRRIHLP